MRVSGWGGFPAQEAEVLRPRTFDALAEAVVGGPLIARGLGRSYGDSSLGPRMLDMVGLDHFVDFDAVTGIVTCEAGVSLDAIHAALVPRGWFLSVTPGTRFVTVGGAIASDVHGKNHHADGTFTDHVRSMRMMVANGDVLEVSRSSHPELFRATCGGMGLTGVILDATFAMRPVTSEFIDETVVKAPDLRSAVAAFDEHAEATYSVAWIDLVAAGPRLGRSLVMVGEHHDGEGMTAGGRGPEGPHPVVPVNMPSALLNRRTVTAFNWLYYSRVRPRRLRHRVGAESFFYPLDALKDWNRLYGRRGFLQHQCVIPAQQGEAPLRDIIARIAASGLASPLAVLKRFGPGNENHLSFPMAGWTLAVDLQASDRSLRLCDELDQLVLAAGGRLYLAKDGRMSAETFQSSYSRIEEFEAVRRAYGAAGTFVSAQSRRLGLS